MLDQITENALVKMAKRIDSHNEVKQNILEQEKLDNKKPNPEYLRVMGLAL